ncbi:exodeoxyribonuclease VII large subunit, partial [Desulfovibrio oxamicus]|nr:exodeoxyribonuclease VII large subunit [Nitratidesulfovibrio oxamicus]
DGGFLRSVSEVAPGDALAVTVRDGEVDVTVRGVRPGQVLGQGGADDAGRTAGNGVKVGTGATEQCAGDIS